MDWRVISAIRGRQVDCQTTNEARNHGRTDADELAYAAASGRAIVTANQRDYVRLHTAWLREGTPHAGIIVVTSQRIPVGLLVAKLVYLQRRTPSEMRSSIVFLGSGPIAAGEDET
jgi:hypothetical protein